MITSACNYLLVTNFCNNSMKYFVLGLLLLFYDPEILVLPIHRVLTTLI